jgi:serine/threonine protein kinase
LSLCCSGELKLADFGTSKRMVCLLVCMFRTDVMQAGLNPRTHTIAGTPWYMAPEVIQSDTHDYGTSRSEDVC